jgi:CheY-like chemotaxis protein
MAYTDTVLIVDDSPIIVKMLSFLIQKAGYHTACAESAQAALEMLDGRDIGLVITDLNMPHMNGTDLISQIRETSDYRYVPVMLFVPDNDSRRKQIMQSSGATLLFDKKDIQELILPTIKKIIG